MQTPGMKNTKKVKMLSQINSGVWVILTWYLRGSALLWGDEAWFFKQQTSGAFAFYYIYW